MIGIAPVDRVDPVAESARQLVFIHRLAERQNAQELAQPIPALDMAAECGRALVLGANHRRRGSREVGAAARRRRLRRGQPQQHQLHVQTCHRDHVLGSVDVVDGPQAEAVCELVVGAVGGLERAGQRRHLGLQRIALLDQYVPSLRQQLVLAMQGREVRTLVHVRIGGNERRDGVGVGCDRGRHLVHREFQHREPGFQPQPLVALGVVADGDQVLRREHVLQCHADLGDEVGHQIVFGQRRHAHQPGCRRVGKAGTDGTLRSQITLRRRPEQPGRHVVGRGRERIQRQPCRATRRQQQPLIHPPRRDGARWSIAMSCTSPERDPTAAALSCAAAHRV